MSDQQFFNQVGGERISARQIDELIGICRGLAADGAINLGEAEFLQKWLAANCGISGHPVLQTLYHRVSDFLHDGNFSNEEAGELLLILDDLGNRDFEHGEILKSADLPLCEPIPDIQISDRMFCFTGTFEYGRRAKCEAAVIARGGRCGNLTKSTDFLVVGVYATESWKHSTFGNKIIKAAKMRDDGQSISIVSEAHWKQFI